MYALRVVILGLESGFRYILLLNHSVFASMLIFFWFVRCFEHD